MHGGWDGAELCDEAMASLTRAQTQGSIRHFARKRR